MRRFGKIDVLVNSAGFRGPLVPVTDISEKEFDDVILYNFKLVFLCCRAVLKQMVKQKSGSIVSISGTAGREGMAMRGSLCAAKWGVVGLTQTIAKEYGPHGIRANIICPGGMDEPDLREMYAQRAKNLGMTVEAHEAQILSLTPLRKYAKHEEVAQAALFLASSDSSHTTGESLNVSGGQIDELSDASAILFLNEATVGSISGDSLNVELNSPLFGHSGARRNPSLELRLEVNQNGRRFAPA